MLERLQRLLELRHLLLGILHAALLHGLAQILHHALQVAIGEMRGVGVERGHRLALALRLLQQRLEVLLDRLLQRLDAAVDLRLVGLALLRRLQRLAQRAARIGQRAGGAVGRGLLEMERELPHAELRLRHRVVIRVAREQRDERAQIEEHAGVVVVGIGRRGDAGERVDRGGAVLGMQAQPLAHRDHRARHRVEEVALGQHELGLGARALLAGGVPARRAARPRAARPRDGR